MRRSWCSGRVSIERGWPPIEAGDARAQLLLGHLYETGESGTPDYTAALYWYRQAALQGIPEAQYALGLMHELGSGTPADAGEAEYWYARAVDHGYCPGELDVEAYWYASSPLSPIDD